MTQVALVTGAGSGIGRAIAVRFLKEGWRVIAVGRSLASLESLRDSHAENSVLPVVCDLTKLQDIESLAQSLLVGGAHHNTFGNALTALINNAGIYTRESFRNQTEEVWRSMLETNLIGPVRITHKLLPLIEKNRGVILNISSTLGVRPVAETGAYSASKAALNNWTETLALELAPVGVRVNSVCPGIIDTPLHSFGPSDRVKLGPMQPLGRVGTPEDVAHAAWSLCGPGSEWTTGAILQVDGGIHLV